MTEGSWGTPRSEQWTQQLTTLRTKCVDASLAIPQLPTECEASTMTSGYSRSGDESRAMRRRQKASVHDERAYNCTPNVAQNGVQ
eukprot:44302-Eustigmatos_ZCMA.PRE.1